MSRTLADARPAFSSCGSRDCGGRLSEADFKVLGVRDSNVVAGDVPGAVIPAAGCCAPPADGDVADPMDALMALVPRALAGALSDRAGRSRAPASCGAEESADI